MYRLLIVALLSSCAGYSDSPARPPDATPPPPLPPDGCCLAGEEWCVFYVGRHECYQFECATHVMATCPQKH
jgi:hypothetical protein